MSLDKSRDGLERAIGLQDRKEHLVRALIIRWTICELDAVEVEGAAIGNGVEQRLARSLARHAAKRLNDRAADEIALQGDKAGVGPRIACGEAWPTTRYKRRRLGVRGC